MGNCSTHGSAPPRTHAPPPPPPRTSPHPRQAASSAPSSPEQLTAAAATENAGSGDDGGGSGSGSGRCGGGREPRSLSGSPGSSRETQPVALPPGPPAPTRQKRRAPPPGLTRQPSEVLTADDLHPDTHVILTKQVRRSRTLAGSKLVNQYEILDDLGQGGYGKVKLVVSIADRRLYAMKVVNKARLAKLSWHGRPALDNIRREVAVLQRLRHPNVVRLHEVMDDPSYHKLFMVTEYCAKGCIAQVDPLTGVVSTERDSAHRLDSGVLGFGFGAASGGGGGGGGGVASMDDERGGDDGSRSSEPCGSGRRSTPVWSNCAGLAGSTGGSGGGAGACFPSTTTGSFGSASAAGGAPSASAASPTGAASGAASGVDCAREERGAGEEGSASPTAPEMLISPPTPDATAALVRSPVASVGGGSSASPSATSWGVGAAPVLRVRTVAAAVASALRYCHSLGVVHRDIKPSNILVDASGTPKLGDFGAAIAFDESGSLLHGTMEDTASSGTFSGTAGTGGATATTLPGGGGDDLNATVVLSSPYYATNDAVFNSSLRQEKSERYSRRRSTAAGVEDDRVSAFAVDEATPASSQPRGDRVTSIKGTFSPQERGLFVRGNVRSVEGTPAYWSPEVCRMADGDGSAASLHLYSLGDCWQVGVLLYFFFMNELPFCGNGHRALKKHVLSQDPEGMTSFPPPVAGALGGLLEKDLDKRWNMDDLLECVAFWQCLETYPHDTAAAAVAAAASASTTPL